MTAPQVIPSAEAEPRVPAINARLWHLVGIKDYLLLKPIQDDSEVVGEPTAAGVMAT